MLQAFMRSGSGYKSCKRTPRLLCQRLKTLRIPLGLPSLARTSLGKNAECELTVSRVELARERDAVKCLSEELSVAKAALTAHDMELQASRAQYELARLILAELNNRAISTIQALMRAFSGIEVHGLSLPRDDSAVAKKLRWVEKAGKLAEKASTGYGMWCSWATTHMLSRLLRGKGCSHIGPSARVAPYEVTALFTTGSG